MDSLVELWIHTNQNPLDSILDEFRVKYNLHNNQITGEYSLQISEVKAYREIICELISDLRAHIRKFRHFAAITALHSQLDSLITQIITKNVPASEFEELVASIYKPASDRKIWHIVINIANRFVGERPTVGPVTKIPLMTTTFSWANNFQYDSEMLHYAERVASLPIVLKSELTGMIFRYVDNFWEEHFENKTWSDLTRRIWENFHENRQCGSDNLFWVKMNEEAKRSWLHAFQDRFPNHLLTPMDNAEEDLLDVCRKREDPFLPGKFSHNIPDKQHAGVLRVRQIDFLVESSDIAESMEHKWRDVRVVGELASSRSQLGKSKYQLMRCMREIFYGQPLRRFVHGLCVYQNYVEFWIVDRAGAYNSVKVDMTKSQEKLIRGLSSYMLMSDKELGLDPIISHDDVDQRFITISGDQKLRKQIKVYPVPIARPGTIGSRGNACYIKDNMQLMKFSWCSDAKQIKTGNSEPDINPSGIVRLKRSLDISEVETRQKRIKISRGQKSNTNSSEKYLSRGTTINLPSRKYSINRELTLAILKPSCRPFRSSTVREFIVGIRDVIIWHRNLYQKGIVLGDVTAGNIVQTRSNEMGAKKGFLIDFDLISLRQYNEKYDLMKSLSRPIQYLALELLHSIAGHDFSQKKTYRHDLESFFYVLIIGCMSYGRDSIPKHLKSWSSDRILTSLSKKHAHVVIDFEEKIISYFMPKFEGVKELARTFHHILFGDRHVSYGSPRNHNVLYGPIITAFNDTIRRLEYAVLEENKDDRIEIKVAMELETSKKRCKDAKTKS